MNKYTEKDVAQSDKLMNKLIHNYKRFYLSIKNELRLDKIKKLC